MSVEPGQTGRTDSGIAMKAALAGMVALATAMGIGRFVYTPILPAMMEALDLSKSLAGGIASANFVGYLAGALFAAVIRPVGGRDRWAVAGLLASAVTTGAMGLTESAVLFGVLRFAGGVASAIVLVFGASLILERLGHHGRPGLSALLFGGVGVGIAVSAIGVMILDGAGAGWAGMWLGSAALSLMAVVVVALLLPRDNGALPGTAIVTGDGTSGPLIRLIVAYGLFGIGYVITATFISILAKAELPQAGGDHSVWLWVGLAGVPSVAVWNWVAGRIGYARAFAIACLVEAVAVALSVLATGVAALLISGALLGGTFMGITALGLAYARRLATGDSSRSIAWMTVSFGLGQIIGPVFAGIVGDVTGSFLVPSLVASCVLLIGAGLVYADRNRMSG